MEYLQYLFCTTQKFKAPAEELLKCFFFSSLLLSRYNRQFRCEERDKDGFVKGRYGFFDHYGKLQLINYSADPYKGFHAEGAHVPKYPH